MARAITGLSEDEQAVVNGLVETLQQKGRRNRVRSRYMDGKRAVRALSPMLPPYLRKVGAVLEWPAKAVEALARRVRLTGFELPGDDLSRWGLDRLVDDNRYVEEAQLGDLAAFTHSVAWEVVTRGGRGEPDAMITTKSALDGTGDWNRRTRRLDSFLSVVEWDTSGREPSEFNLYLPGETVMVSGGKVQDRSKHPLWVPVHPLPYRPRLDRPFGQSRISRSVMFLTDAAVRAMLRMEGTADFYGTPHILLLGAALDQFSNEDGSAATTWDFLMSKINGLPDDPDAEPGRERADVKQITQASQAPHMDSIDTIAAAFSGVANIPVSSLGVGVKQANPTSADSYIASREDLIGDAEDAIDTFAPARERALQDAWLLASGESVLPPELRRLQAVYRDPRLTSRSAAADATTKLISVMPWLAESDAILETVGFDAGMVERLKADRVRARASRNMRALLGGSSDVADESDGVEG